VIQFPELGLRQVPILHPLFELGRERERDGTLERERERWYTSEREREVVH